MTKKEKNQWHSETKDDERDNTWTISRDEKLWNNILRQKKKRQEGKTYRMDYLHDIIQEKKEREKENISYIWVTP